MKTRKVLLLQALFFLLISLSMHLLNEYILIKRLIYIALITGLTFILYYYFYNSVRVFKRFLIMLISLFLLFEFTKSVEYSLGLLPKYTENTCIGAILALACIAMYLGAIILICQLIKITRSNKHWPPHKNLDHSK